MVTFGLRLRYLVALLRLRFPFASCYGWLLVGCLLGLHTRLVTHLHVPVVALRLLRVCWLFTFGYARFAFTFRLLAVTLRLFTVTFTFWLLVVPVYVYGLRFAFSHSCSHFTTLHLFHTLVTTVRLDYCGCLFCLVVWLRSTVDFVYVVRYVYRYVWLRLRFVCHVYHVLVVYFGCSTLLLLHVTRYILYARLHGWLLVATILRSFVRLRLRFTVTTFHTFGLVTFYVC